MSMSKVGRVLASSEVPVALWECGSIKGNKNPNHCLDLQERMRTQEMPAQEQNWRGGLIELQVGIN